MILHLLRMCFKCLIPNQIDFEMNLLVPVLVLVLFYKLKLKSLKGPKLVG